MVVHSLLSQGQRSVETVPMVRGQQWTTTETPKLQASCFLKSQYISEGESAGVQIRGELPLAESLKWLEAPLAFSGSNV